jgi:pyruvate/2-oxoglutarate dehydrogenase complex dihydrolipoamide dehydrogenase (E3) component
MNRRPHRTGTNLSLSPATRGAHICVIGAGPSGLTTLKNLLALGLTNVVCFDSADAIGGNWVFREDQPSVHQFTHTISSKRLSEFEDYPMPADFPDFPSHCEVRAYLDAYAAHFGLAPFIRLKERIETATRRADGRWSVRIATPREIKEVDFDYLIVCSGHHRVALIPNYPGHFGGEVLHSGAFKQAAPFANKRVLVVGGGNSACDIASEISRVASRTCISMRRGSYILPKKMFGYPVDRLYASFRWLPQVISRPLFEAALRMKVGRWRDYGLRAPRARLLEMHPTLNSNVLKALRSGAVVPRVGIARLAENEIEFLDGIVEAFDTIIWATGFRATFPFLDASVVDWNMAECPPLSLKMMHREAANLYFIGFFQPLGCIWRLADHQARIAALQIAGYLNRPADIVARIAREMGTRRRRFDQSTRHAIEVDYHEFRRELLAYIKTARIAPRDLPGSIWDQRGAPHQGSDIGKIVVRRLESSNANGV